MQIFRFKIKYGLNRLMYIDESNSMYYMGKLGRGISVADVWKHQNFLLGEADLGVTPFFSFDSGTLAYSNEVANSPLGSVLKNAGEILPGTLEDVDEPVHVLNILEIYDCLDVNKSEFWGRSRVEAPFAEAMEIAKPSFLANKIGRCTLFKVSMETDVMPCLGAPNNFTVTGRPEVPEEEDFYCMCKKCGLLDYFEFEECSFS